MHAMKWLFLTADAAQWPLVSHLAADSIKLCTLAAVVPLQQTAKVQHTTAKMPASEIALHTLHVGACSSLVML